MQCIRKERIAKRIDELIDRFSYYLGFFQKKLPFGACDKLTFHKKVLDLRNKHSDAFEAINDNEFTENLYIVLQKWGIGKRGSRIKPYADFKASLLEHGRDLIHLDRLTIVDNNINVDTIKDMASVLFKFDIVENDSKLVANSKALHHIIPNLFVPIDREYTRKFFNWFRNEFQNNQLKCFNQAMISFNYICQSVECSTFIDSQWNTCITKVIDNAIIGFVLSDEKTRSFSG